MASKPVIHYAVHNGINPKTREAIKLKVNATPLVTMKALNNGDFTFEKVDSKKAE